MPEFAPGRKARDEAFRGRMLDKLNPLATPRAEQLSMTTVASEIAAAIDGRVMGAGAERIVIERPDGKVLGIYRYPKREGALELKKKFYTARILNTLFPQFFPHVYATGLSSSFPQSIQPLVPVLQKLFPEYVLSFTVTEKIDAWAKEEKYIVTTRNTEGEMVSTEMEFKSPSDREEKFQELSNAGTFVSASRERKVRSGPNKEGEYPSEHYLQAHSVLEKLGVQVWTDDEPGKNNVGAVYTDGTMTLAGTDGSKGTDYEGFLIKTHSLSDKERDQVLAWMHEEKYSEEARQTVETSFNRLLALESEE